MSRAIADRPVEPEEVVSVHISGDMGDLGMPR